MANTQPNHVILMYPFIHAHNAILYKSHYSHLQNSVEAIRRDHSSPWLVMLFMAATTTQ